MYYGVTVPGSFIILNYSTKCYRISISVYFHLGVNISIIYFKQGCKHHVTFLFLKYLLAWVYSYKLFIFSINLCKGSVMALKFHMSFQKSYTKLEKDCTYLFVIGAGYPFKLLRVTSLHTFRSYIKPKEYCTVE